MIDILGLPSGQLINVNKRELKVLIDLGFVQWDINYGEFLFKDIYLDEIKKFMKTFYIHEIVITGTGKYGTIIEIINYNGNKVNGKDISKIFKIGDILYVVKFGHNNIGVYTKDQLEKVRDNISINENQNISYNIIDLIGLPSGQVIEIYDNELNFLKKSKLIKWNGSRNGYDGFIGYSFNDKDKKIIMDNLYQLY